MTPFPAGKQPDGRKRETMRAVTRIFLVSVLIIALSGAVASYAAGQEQATAPVEKPGQPRFRIGAYFEGWQLNDKKLVDFFGHSQINRWAFEASVHTVYNIDVWATYRTYFDETKTTYYQNADQFQIKATSIGIIYRPLVWTILEPFIGAGAEIYSYSEKVEGDTDLPDTSGNAAGFHFQLGTYVNFWKYMAGKVFFRLNSVNETLADALPDGTTKLDLGGKEFGVGLVVRF
jgi:opacity protein-like surface antigen